MTVGELPSRRLFGFREVASGKAKVYTLSPIIVGSPLLKCVMSTKYTLLVVCTWHATKYLQSPIGDLPFIDQGF